MSHTVPFNYIDDKARLSQSNLVRSIDKKTTKAYTLSKSSAQWSLFQRMTADVSSVRVERFGENNPFFEKWVTCRTVYSMNGFQCRFQIYHLSV